MARRRANGEETLRERPDGRWEITIMVGYRDNGKRKYKSFYGKTQKEVRTKAKEYQLKKEAGLAVDVQYLFPDWTELWYENHKDNTAPTTQKNYLYTLRILNKAFARRNITDIKPYDFEIFLNRDGRSGSCLTQGRGMMYQIMNKAEATTLSARTPPLCGEDAQERPHSPQGEFYGGGSQTPHGAPTG